VLRRLCQAHACTYSISTGSVYKRGKFHHHSFRRWCANSLHIECRRGSPGRSRWKSVQLCQTNRPQSTSFVRNSESEMSDISENSPPPFVDRLWGMNLIGSAYAPLVIWCDSSHIGSPGEGDVWRKHRRIVGPAFNNKAYGFAPLPVVSSLICANAQISACLERDLKDLP
jgi:hypothetical protein